MKTICIALESSQPRAEFQRGFTLIELSIVLVILGLITGGILVGRDLIKTAQLRTIITQTEQTNTGVMTFRLKYNGIPGDSPNATQFFGAKADCNDTDYTAQETCNGNGNGLLVSSENRYFWQQLRAANLIKPPRIVHTTSFTQINYLLNYTAVDKLGFVIESGLFFIGIPSWKSESDGNTYNMYDPLSYSATSKSLSAIDAYYLDSKIDDGLPGKGSVYASGTTYDPDCVTSTNKESALYKMDQNGSEKLCGFLFFKAPF